jgi:hypothetical protein
MSQARRQIADTYCCSPGLSRKNLRILIHKILILNNIHTVTKEIPPTNKNTNILSTWNAFNLLEALSSGFHNNPVILD